MICTSFDSEELKTSYLIFVLEPDNLSRMKTGDPFTVETIDGGGILPSIRYPNKVKILIGYEEDEAMLYKLARRHDLKALVAYLTRGLHFNKDIDGVGKEIVIPPEEKK